MKSRFYATHVNQIAEHQDKLDRRSKRDGKKQRFSAQRGVATMHGRRASFKFACDQTCRYTIIYSLPIESIKISASTSSQPGFCAWFQLYIPRLPHPHRERYGGQSCFRDCFEHGYIEPHSGLVKELCRRWAVSGVCGKASFHGIWIQFGPDDYRKRQSTFER